MLFNVSQKAFKDFQKRLSVPYGLSGKEFFSCGDEIEEKHDDVHPHHPKASSGGRKALFFPEEINPKRLTPMDGEEKPRPPLERGRGG